MIDIIEIIKEDLKFIPHETVRYEFTHQRFLNSLQVDFKNALLYVTYAKAVNFSIIYSDDNLLIIPDSSEVFEGVKRFSTSVLFGLGNSTQKGEVKYVLVHLIRK